MIVSKKLKEDEEGPKKAKKPKKKKEDGDKISGFTHQIGISVQFEAVNLLPPYTALEIDNIIKQLQDKI